MMKNKWKKRIATIVMSLCLLMGLMPTKVFAEENTYNIPIYSCVSEEGGYAATGGYATFTSESVFTLGTVEDWQGARIDYYFPMQDPTSYGLEAGFDKIVEYNISFPLTGFEENELTGTITFPLPSGYDGETAKILGGDTATASNETTVTFPITLDVSAGEASQIGIVVEYKQKQQQPPQQQQQPPQQQQQEQQPEQQEQQQQPQQHQHSYGDWQKDATNHWHECECGYKTGSAHSYDNAVDPTCNVCGYERAVTYTSQSGEVCRRITAEGNSTVAIDGSENFIPAGAKFRSAQVTEGDVYNRASELVSRDFGSETAFLVFEMNLLDSANAEIHQLNGYVNVTIPIPEGLSTEDGKRLVVYRVEEDGTLTRCTTSVENGYLTFSTDHFSTYVVVEESSVTSPKTGDENGVPFLVLVAVAAVACGAFFGKRKLLANK